MTPSLSATISSSGQRQSAVDGQAEFPIAREQLADAVFDAERSDIRVVEQVASHVYDRDLALEPAGFDCVLRATIRLARKLILLLAREFVLRRPRLGARTHVLVAGRIQIASALKTE